MSQRFFVDTPLLGDQAELRGAEAQHLLKVMRGKVGDEIVLFDGGGEEFTGRIAAIERQCVRVGNLLRRPVDRELPFSFEVAVALPKGDRQRWLVEKLTELGVTRLVPLVTARGVVQPDGGTVARLARAVVESSKQCGRNQLMEVAPPQMWHDFAAAAPAAALRLLAHPPASPDPSEPGESAGCTAGEGTALSSTSSNRLPERSGRDVVAAVGPEGGFTAEEVGRGVDCKWELVSLGPRILRVETAAIALAAAYGLQ